MDKTQSLHKLDRRGADGHLADDRLSKQLRKVGLRPTSIRLQVWEVLLASSQTSLGAHEVFRELVKFGGQASFASIYRVLSELELCKLIQRERHFVGSISKSRYVAAPAVLPPSSYTFTCRVCKRGTVVADAQLSEHLYRQAKAAGFDVQLETVAIRMTCNACATGKAA